MLQIAIDGPAGAGKSSIAKAIAQELGITYLDTGAMYRACALFVLQSGILPSDGERVSALMRDIALDIGYKSGSQHVLLNGANVTENIRLNEVSSAASSISAIPAVREQLVDMQRRIAAGKSVVMDGRDIGSVVLPSAKFKFYVTATPMVRAKRRYDELLQKGTLNGRTVIELCEEIETRDYNDSNREHSPLVCVSSAIVVDTTKMTLEQAVEFVLECIGKN